MNPDTKRRRPSRPLAVTPAIVPCQNAPSVQDGVNRSLALCAGITANADLRGFFAARVDSAVGATLASAIPCGAPQASEVVVAELGLQDTNGILRQSWVRPRQSSAGLGWDQLYLSAQSERPYRADFPAAHTHLVVLHVSGPVAVTRGAGKHRRSQTVPAGGISVVPAGRELAMELSQPLETIHAYLAAEAVEEALDEPIKIADDLGTTDPLAEQIMLALNGVMRRWEPCARTYVDHLTMLLALHLAQRPHGRYDQYGTRDRLSGLSPAQLAAVRGLLQERLAEPVTLADLARAASMSVSQLSRRFKASTGETPHRYLARMRLEHACRLLRSTSLPIAEIAACSGFSHQEHLTRVMRARLNTTPAALRENV